MADPASIATGRNVSLFAGDISSRSEEISAAFRDRRVLVIGGAGSIGAATVRAILPYRPAALHIIDHNENGLADLVRDLRSAGIVDASLDLQLMPLDYGAPVAHRFLSLAGPYDVVLHFAALKHVRSEKDVASILQMLDTNVLKQQQFISWLAEEGLPERYFAVSTDKAANPANFMGASKRLMEQLLFTDGCSELSGAKRTSARFANVAFSAGSLLASFGERIRNRQPIAVPCDTRRFFVSVDEAAEICILSAVAVPDRHVAIPRMHEADDLHELTPIAEEFVKRAGYRPRSYEDEELARSSVEKDAAAGAWPILSTPRDTEGEKEREVFLGKDEEAREIGLSALLGVAQSGADKEALQATISELRDLTDHPHQLVTKTDLAEALQRAIPEFEPIRSGKTLDDRM